MLAWDFCILSATMISEVRNTGWAMALIFPKASESVIDLILRRHYLEGARGAILVYDITNKTSFKNLKKWLGDLDKYCGKVPIILVGNKSDLNTDRKISTNLGSELAEETKIEFLETSAKSGNKVKDVFNMIAENNFERYVPK